MSQLYQTPGAGVQVVVLVGGGEVFSVIESSNVWIASTPGRRSIPGIDYRKCDGAMVRWCDGAMEVDESPSVRATGVSADGGDGPEQSRPGVGNVRAPAVRTHTDLLYG